MYVFVCAGWTLGGWMRACHHLEKQKAGKQFIQAVKDVLSSFIDFYRTKQQNC